VLAQGTLAVLLHAELRSHRSFQPRSYTIADGFGWETVLVAGEIGAVVVFVAGWQLWGAAWVLEGLAATEGV
jgi:hypothetical protein